jgi:hypothetical protein
LTTSWVVSVDASKLQTVITDHHMYQCHPDELTQHLPCSKGQASTATWLEQLLEKANIRPETTANHQGAPALSLALHCESPSTMLRYCPQMFYILLLSLMFDFQSFLCATNGMEHRLPLTSGLNTFPLHQCYCGSCFMLGPCRAPVLRQSRGAHGMTLPVEVFLIWWM